MNNNIKTLAALGSLLVTSPALAVEFHPFGADATLTNKLAAGFQMRLAERQKDLVGIGNGGNAFTTNGDAGNLAWDRNEITSAGVKLTSDLSISSGNFGFFFRGSGIYNPVLDRKNYFNDADYSNNPAVKEASTQEELYKMETIQKHVGRDLDILDAYVYGRFDIGERAVNLKVGRQVLNWGESTFIQHGLNALITADVNRLRSPGFEIEEVQIPVGMVVLSGDLIENVGLETFYQFEWQHTVIDAPGTLLSTNDFAGIGGTRANIGFGRAMENQPASSNANPATWCYPPPSLVAGFGSPCIPFGSTVPRAPDRDAEDGGQYGAKLALYIPWLNNMDMALYAANFHSRLPLISGTSRNGPTDPSSDANYFVEYPEDIKLYGVSFNTTVALFDVAVQGEYSYKADQPLQVDDVEVLLAGLGAAGQVSPVAGGTLGHQYLRGWRRHDVSQVDLGLTKIIGPHMGFDQWTLLFEGGYVHVHDLPSPEVLAYDAPSTSTMNPGTAALNPASAAGLPVTAYSDYATSNSWGYKLASRWSINNVLGAFNVEPTLLFQHDVKGITPTPIVNFVENRKQLNAILGFNYLQTYQLDFGWTRFWGGGVQNLLTDRDFLEVALKYSF